MSAFRCKKFILVLWLPFLINMVPVRSLKGHDEDSCLSLLPESYHRSVPTGNEGGAASVFLQIAVIDFDEISEETMDFRLHGYIRSVWKDPRISLNSTTLPEDCIKHIWIPDLMFEDAKSIIDTGQHNILFAVRNDYLYMSQRYSLKVACMMRFEMYPFDTQHCAFAMSFMATDDSAAILKWFDDKQSPYRNASAPILVKKDIEPLQFHIGAPTTHSEVKSFLYSNFTYLYANFTLYRRLTGSIVNYYMPSALLVIVSWVSFWLQADAASERVTLPMTALLTICTQGNQYKSELPPVNYISAMDIWYFVCISMLVATLLEFAFSYSASRKERKKKKRKMKTRISTVGCCKHFVSPEKQDADFVEDSKESEEASFQKSTKMFGKIVHFIETTDLDSIAKVLFPGFFFTFTAVYWSVYYCWSMSVL